MPKKRVGKGYEDIGGTKLKAPMYSPVFREVEKIKREPPGKPPPEAEYREYDVNRAEVVIASKAKQSHEKGNKRIRRETCRMTR